MSMDDGTQRAIDQIQKLMKLAGNNPNENEAAAALAKAQALLAAYNLDMAVVESKSGASGKRADEQIAGGMHKYSRMLWQAIAELNFCMYWTMKVRTKSGTPQFRRGRKFTHEHRLVGRTVNIASTRAMAGYLEQTIERLCRTKLGSEAHTQYYSSWAVAFREGVADRVLEKIRERRDIQIEEEEVKARKAGREGVSTATALTIATVADAEEAANYDFIHGDGAWARKAARDAEWEAEWAERRQRQAEAQAEAEKVYAEWATAHPEEAAAEAAKQRAKDRARERRSSNRRYSFRQTREDMRRESGGYYAGYDAGANVSIDPQMDKASQRRIAR